MVARTHPPRRCRDRQSAQARPLCVVEEPENLTTRQQAKLAWIAKTDPTLHRAYLLKEGLRLVFQLDYDEAVEALEAWIGWARRCRIPTFVDLQRRIVKIQGLDPRRH